MCLLLLALRAHPVYKLVIAANRDEFYERPTEPAGFWGEQPQILAGRDLRAGGTWFGISRNGRIAAITNYREPAPLKSAAPSRGSLVSDFLRGHETPEEYLSRLATNAEKYNGFNLVVGIKDQIFWYSNRGHGICPIVTGLHGLSNHLLDTPWPKVSRAKTLLGDILSSTSTLSPGIFFDMLLDQSIPANNLLPDTGVGIKLERILSPIFVSTPGYGTRSSTILTIDRENHVTFVERTYDSSFCTHKDASFEFIIQESDLL